MELVKLVYNLFKKIKIKMSSVAVFCVRKLAQTAVTRTGENVSVLCASVSKHENVSLLCASVSKHERMCQYLSVTKRDSMSKLSALALKSS